MNDHQRQTADVDSLIKSFMAHACAGEIEALRDLVAGGFDLNGRNQFGDTILEYTISTLDLYPQAPKYAVIREMLRLGADPDGPSQDGSRPVFAAALNMDTEMLRLLLDAGADPNVVHLRTDSDGESLYDWAHAVYLDEVWQGHSFTEVKQADREDEETWLRHLSRLAHHYDKARPEHLQLLRERGALSMFELHSDTRNRPPRQAARNSQARKSL
jgi:hypothetical protein